MIIDESGKTYGRLKVMGLGPPSDGASWKCQCDCGKVVNVMGNSLRRGHSRSCGCLQREESAKRFAALGRKQGPKNALTAERAKRRLSEPRECSRCKITKAAQEFGPLKSVATGVDIRRTVCKVCQAQSVYRWKANHPEENSKRVREAALKGRYGLTHDEYQSILDRQNGLCAICRKVPRITLKRLHIDHDHASGKVRGLLCVNCNMLIGMARESIPTLAAAIIYLDEHSDQVSTVEKN